MAKSDIEKRASEWIFELETSACFESIWPRFQSWLNEDPQHVMIYRRLEKAWRLSREVLKTCSFPTEHRPVGILVQRSLTKH